MNNLAVAQDMHKSSSLVMNKIKPIVEELLDGWTLMQVEEKNDEVCKLLDIYGGIDYLLFSEKSGFIHGLASRVQYNLNFRTFTVRKQRQSGASTEFDKRFKAISYGAFFPSYTMQAYIEDDTILSMAITKTTNLIDFIDKGFAKVKSTNYDKIGQALFYICEWDKMTEKGYRLLEYSKKTTRLNHV